MTFRGTAMWMTRIENGPGMRVNEIRIILPGRVGQEVFDYVFCVCEVPRYRSMTSRCMYLLKQEQSRNKGV